MLSAIAHQMWRILVLPSYPHSSKGAYAKGKTLFIITQVGSGLPTKIAYVHL